MVPAPRRRRCFQSEIMSMENTHEKRAKPVVLVIGAGASKEVNLPLGADLTKQIARVRLLNLERQ